MLPGPRPDPLILNETKIKQLGPSHHTQLPADVSIIGENVVRSTDCDTDTNESLE